jgi:hypothetical protein
VAGNAEYVIDVAAQLTGDETLAELDELTSELMGAGRGAEFFQQAIQRVSRDLEAAASAAASANADLAAGQVEYRALEAAANQAAKTVEKLGLKGDVMSRAYIEAAKASADASSALGTHAAKLAGLEEAAAGAAAREEKLADTMRGVTKISSHVDKSIAGQAEAYEKLGSSLGAIGGPVGQMGSAIVRPIQGFSKLSASIGEANAAAVVGAVGFGALAAAAVALTAAVAIGALKVAEYAITLGDTARNAGLAREAFEAMNPGVAALSSTVDALNSETKLGVPTLNGLAKGLLDAGESSENMARSLRVAALAEKALGAGAASEYTRLVKAASDAQKAVDEAARKSGGAISKELTQKLDDATTAASTFASRAETKLGGVVARQMQGLDAQGDRLSSNLATLFGGLDIDPALAGLAKLVDLFDENSASGKAIKFIFEQVFQPLIDGADDAATAVEAFVLGFLIGAMKLYLALRPAIDAVAEFFGLDGSSLGLDFKTLTAVGEALAPVFLLVAAVIGGVLLAAFVAVGALVAAQIAVWYVLVEAIGIVWETIKLFASALWDIGKTIFDAIVEPFNAVVAFLSGEIDFATLVGRLIMNVVNTIASLATTVLSTFVALLTAPIDYIFGLDLSGAGRNLISGFVGGIVGSIGNVINAVKNAMGAAINAAKSMLGIASPSKVFEGIADFTTEGFTGTIDANTGDVQDSMADMLAVPPANDIAPPVSDFMPANDIAPSPAELLKQAQLSGDTATIERLQGATSPADDDAPKAPRGDDDDSGSGKGGGANLAGATFNFYGLPDAKGALASFEEMLDAAVEGDAAKLGAAAARGKTAA